MAHRHSTVRGFAMTIAAAALLGSLHDFGVEARREALDKSRQAPEARGPVRA